jgi:hypothetical protein
MENTKKPASVSFYNGSPRYFDGDSDFLREAAASLTKSIYQCLKPPPAVRRIVLLNHSSLVIEQHDAMILTSPIEANKIL